MRHLLLIAILLLSILNYSCNNSEASSEKNYDDNLLLNSKQLQRYQMLDIDMLKDQYFKNFSNKVKFAVKLYKIEYKFKNDKYDEILSGAILVPDCKDSCPIFSLQHATVINRDNVLSNNKLESFDVVFSLYLASSGYIVFMPDYIGYGSSNSKHPYILAKPNAESILAMIDAGKIFLEKEHIPFKDNLFLAGYSEGAYNTCALVDYIQKNELNYDISAVASLSGLYDIKQLANDIFKNEEYPNIIYPAFFLDSYIDYYKWNNAKEIYRNGYHERIPDLFSGSLMPKQVMSSLPNNLNELINYDNSFKILQSEEKIKQFEENTVLNSEIEYPIIITHARHDRIIPYESIMSKFVKLNNEYPNFSFYTIERANHSNAQIESFSIMMKEFEKYRLALYK